MRTISYLIRLTAIPVAFLAFLTIHSCQNARAGGADRDLQESDRQAVELYNQYCANCHGTDLRGGNAQSLLDGIWQFGDGNGYVRRNIEFGIPHLGMPSYASSLSSKEIRLLVDYLYEEQDKAGVEKPDPPSQLESIEYSIKSEVWVDDLEIPWAIVFLNDDTALITERPGRLRVVAHGELAEQAVAGIPEVLHEGQGGLMDVNMGPDYKKNGWIYLSYSHEIAPADGEERSPAMTRIVRGRIRDMKWVDEQVIYEAPHAHLPDLQAPLWQPDRIR